MPIAFPGGTVYLSRGPETYALQDVIWPGKKELVGVIKIVKNGELDLEGPGYTLHVGSGGGSEGAVLSLNPGATQELALLFQVPEDAKDGQLRLHAPGGLTVALAGPAGPAVIPTAQPSASAAAGVSAMFRGNLARTGEGTGKPVGHTPKLRWKYKAGKMISSPIIAGDAVYIFTMDWKSVALDLASGAVRWKIPVWGVVATPAVAEGRVLIALDQSVMALDTASGRVLWVYPSSNPMFIWGSPAVRQGFVYVASLAGEIDVLDLVTGELRGKWNISGPSSSSLAFSEDTLFFLTWNKEITAWGVDSSAQRWNVNLYPNVHAGRLRSFDNKPISANSVWLVPGSAVVGETAVYAQKIPLGLGDPAGVVALEKETGKALWEFTPQFTEDEAEKRVSGFPQLERLSITSDQGESRWDLRQGDRVSSAPALAGGTVVFGAIDGKIYAIDAATGKQKWAFVTKDWVYSSPTIAGGLVFIGSDDGNLYALDLTTGAERWRFRTKGLVRTTPATADGVVVFGSGDGYVYALQE